MNCHERMIAALNLGQPDRVPVFSCTEEQNQIYEILGGESGAVPLSLIQEGFTGALVKLAVPLVNASGWFNRQIEKFMSKKVEADVAMGYDCSWLMYSAIFNLRGNRQATDIYGRLYDLVADPDGNMDTPMYREGLLTTPERWDAWPHPDPDKLHKTIHRVFADLQQRYGGRIYLMGSLCWGIWENVSQVMGLPGFAVTLRRDPDFVRRMVKYYERLYLAAVHAAADAGMPGFVYSDDMGYKSGPQTSPRVMEEFFGSSLRRIADEAHKRGLKIIIHSCGNIYQLLDLFVDWGFDGVHSLEPTAGIDLAEGFALIAASTAQQVAQEWKEKEHGVFTYYLLEGLSGQADRDGKEFVTVDDLKTHVLDGLRRWNVEHGGLLQEPTARTEGLGDIILADYRG